MFNRSEKKPIGKLTKDLIPLSLAETILSDDKRQQCMKRIEDNSTLESERFKSLCLSLIQNLVNYSQLLPETNNRHYSQLGGFIEYALNRTDNALSLFKQYLIVDSSGQVSDEQKLWQYALFSAALLQGIGKFYTDLQVNLFDLQGKLLRKRDPLTELLTIKNVSFYSYTFLEPKSQEFRQRLNGLIARFIMPASGLDWLSSNSKVFEIWLALLNEDLYGAGTLGFILDRARAMALQKYNQSLSRIPLSIPSRLPFGAGITDTNGLEQQMGIEFIQWLSKALEKGDLEIDNPPILAGLEGLILTTEVFKQFIKHNPHYKSLPAVQNAFLALGLHRLGLGGEAVANYEHPGTHKIEKGIFVSDYKTLLPEKMSLYNDETKESQTISAIELTAKLNSKPLSSLNAEGNWEQNQNIQKQGLSPNV